MAGADAVTGRAGAAPVQLAQASGPVANPESAALTPDEAVRMRKLSEELRCLVCQNQSLADSNAELAVDLRNQVRDLIRSGRDDSSIKTYLVERYGDFVLYQPPVQSNTLLLWFGPFVLLLVGILAWRLVQRRSAAARPQGTAAAASPLDIARARDLLDEDRPGR